MSVVMMSLSDALKTYPDVKELVYEKNSAMDEVINSNLPSISRLRRNISVFMKFIEQKIVGWSWMIPYSKDNKQVYCFMIYINPNFRRFGYAKELFNHAKNLARQRHRRLVVFPWNTSSRNFFNSVGVSNKNKKNWYSLHFNVVEKRTNLNESSNY